MILVQALPRAIAQLSIQRSLASVLANGQVSKSNVECHYRASLRFAAVLFLYPPRNVIVFLRVPTYNGPVKTTWHCFVSWSHLRITTCHSKTNSRSLSASRSDHTQAVLFRTSRPSPTDTLTCACGMMGFRNTRNNTAFKRFTGPVWLMWMSRAPYLAKNCAQHNHLACMIGTATQPKPGAQT